MRKTMELKTRMPKIVNVNASRIVLLTVVLLQLLSPGMCMAEFLGRFTDPTDGAFDASAWLLNQKGFLPVPILITEPAIGYGLGVGLVFFHDSIAAKASREKIEAQEQAGEKSTQMVPPSVSGVGAFKTENDTWGAVGFHFGAWKKDHIRYTGGIGKVSLNLSFYGTSEDSPISNGLDYNLEGWGLLQTLKFRMGDSRAFVGGKITYLDTTSTFDTSSLPIEVNEWELEFKNIGLGFVVEYDSQDNMFSPERGVQTTLEAMFYNGEGLLGKPREYQITTAGNRAYWSMNQLPLVWGWRVGGSFSSGEVPFFALPFIQLRGVPMQRYQGKHVLDTELEARYRVSSRWTAVGFGGVGQTADTLNDFGSNEYRWAGGAGIRYLIARVLKLQYGFDVARGPEDWVFYLTVGSGL